MKRAHSGSIWWNVLSARRLAARHALVVALAGRGIWHVSLRNPQTGALTSARP
jgi:hypothetical protein